MNEDLNLVWWRIELNCFRLPKDHSMQDPVALTIISTTRDQSKQINKWCKDNGIFRIKTSRWEDTYKYTRQDGSVGFMSYINSEKSVVGERHIVQKLEKWLRTFPRRNYQVVVEGVKKNDIRAITKGIKNIRILPDIEDETVCLFSLADPILHMELILRSD